MSRNRIAASEKQASEDESVSDTLFKDGNEAADIIENIVDELHRLRAISIKNRYGVVGHSAENAKQLRELSENLRNTFQIRVFEETVRPSAMLGYLVKQEWP